ncbi:quinone oxidoreductase family protein [Sorangium sp. So ce131]|uniref:quinone oxidoreductase family protein n=1 Tax=Sorangium sp. So ce131 TaxID=3133282 RepID=UPI003F637593
METKSRAIVMRRTGPPEVLAVEEIALAPLARGEVRLRALASAINYSDLQIRAGSWPIKREQRFPYVPGLEVVGEVVEVAPDVSELAVGDRAWTTMQGLGGVRAERDGGYAEHVTVAAGVLAPLPADVDAVEFAAVGLAGVTAIEAMRRLGPLDGRTLVVSGATGGVGAVAVEIGRALGATVVALERSSPPPQPGSADVVLDGVAGALFPTLVAALRPGGRYCIVGAAAGGEVAFDAWSLLDGRALTGYSTEDLDGDALRAATRELLRLKLPPPPTKVLPLAEAARAHALLEQRAVRGRVVLVP